MRSFLNACLLFQFMSGSLFSKEVVLVEAESFSEKGGWLVDQQFMDLMGSPYLLAHGLGVKVPNAGGEVAFPKEGEYRVWVRTKDWVAPWKAPGAPGKFKVLVDGVELKTVFGTKGAKWHWQDGGLIKVGKKVKLELHDLTGFEGRCDAILFCEDHGFEPPHGGKELEKFRAGLLGWDKEPEDGGNFDLVVVGGGIAGTSAAISGARQGLKVALIQDRPVLGGNGSSEVRVWPEGHINQKPYTHVGDIVRELMPPRPPGQGMAMDLHYYDDKRKERVVRAEKNITLMLNHRMVAADTKDEMIRSVIAQHIHSGKRKRVSGKLFLDSTGDGVLGAMAGADFELLEKGAMGVTNPWSVAPVEKNEPQLICECKDKEPLSLAFTQSQVEQPFPRCPWAIDMSELPFPGRKNYTGQWPGGKGPLANLGRWFWESGSGKHPVKDMEWVRDHNFRAMYGAWDTLKNVDKLHPNERLKWAAFIMGKRESRRLLGDVILTADDFRKLKPYEDGCFPCTWHIDIHHPDDRYDDHKEEPFISYATHGKQWSYKGPYWAPYRCLYSRNIGNLFMAGRDISVSQDGLGAVRVMRTCGMMGEIVGKAAWLAVRYDTTPRGVYQKHLDGLKGLMKEPGFLRRTTLKAELDVPEGSALKRDGWNIDPKKLAGILIDDEEARFKGKWEHSNKLVGSVDKGYQWSIKKGASVVYPLRVDQSGEYELRMAWISEKSRSQQVKVRIDSGVKKSVIEVNQRKAEGAENGFVTLGRYQFESGKKAELEMELVGGGVIHADAVQLVKVE